jgi:hypothetical protein
VTATRRLPGIGSALAAAIRRTNASFYAIPEPYRPDPNSERWLQLEAEIDQACARGDADAARLAIARWEGHAMRELRGAAEAPQNSAEPRAEFSTRSGDAR